MRDLADIKLTSIQDQALQELRFSLTSQFFVESLILFGSVARGDADAESDIDIMVLTFKPFSRQERHQITDRVFEINLKYGTNFSTLVIDHNLWENGLVSVLPIHHEILNDGVII
jgi:uncharacterized protein